MIKNRKELLKKFKEGKILLDLAEEALDFLQPNLLVKKQIVRQKNNLIIQKKSFNLDKFKNIYIIGAGKATYKMAEEINNILKDRITAGYINVPIATTKNIGKIVVNKASHPFPDSSGVKGTNKILEILKKSGEKDLVICLMSGGGSALMPAPISPMTLSEKTDLTKKLLKCSATIDEINTVRKHLSKIKGGRLAELAMPSSVISLYISDVRGDKLEVIASGPTVEDKTTSKNAIEILKKYKINNKKLFEIIKNNETPKHLDQKKVFNFIIGSNSQVLDHLKIFAKKKKFNVMTMPDYLSGEAKKMASKFLGKLKKYKKYKMILLAGGETVVKIIGHGKGGRNQEFALSSIPSLPENTYLLTLATDGVDGITPEPIAGAIGSHKTKEECEDKKIDIKKYLKNNNSYNCLKALGCLIKTGPSGTNVGDIAMLLMA